MEQQQERRRTLNAAMSTLTSGRTSPILSTLNTSWDDISSTQQKYYQRKAKETILTTLSVISPGQEDDLWDALRKDSTLSISNKEVTSRKSFDPSSPIIDSLVKAYYQADSWQTERQILSIFANDFSRSELMTLIPSLSKWRIDQARQHASDVGKGQLVPEEPIFRTRISSAQVQHFVDFISRPELVHDVAFGTKTLKLDSGESIIIPAVVRTMIPSRIIDQYQRYCEQESFVPAGKRSLYRMIEVCAASQQKSLAGLDNTTAEGNDAIDNMVEIVTSLHSQGADDDWVKDAQQRLKEGKRYLKTEFKGHVGREEGCADHCTTYALSDPNQKRFARKCLQAHDMHCNNCISLEKVLQEIQDKIESASMSTEEKNMKKHECKKNVEAIKSWKAHLLRTVNQEEAKQDALLALDDETCLIVMDWAMKFLPQRYRERMSEFFGKRGRSWHVSAVITKKEGKFESECFVHILDACTQNSFAVASIIEHLLKFIKKETPQIQNAFLRSDNAGCYHSGQLLMSLAEIGKRTGVTPVRYDFSDPQSGKDICDRKTAPMKAHIKRWVNEKHDVLSASDMKNALESYGGVKGCRAAVVQVNVSAENSSTNKIPGISLLNNFAFVESGIRVWRAYNNGLGKVLTYKDLDISPQQDTNLQIIDDFGPRTSQGTVSNTKSTRADIFFCSENTCVLTFKTMEEADAHMDTGKHVKVSECESVYDTVRKRWADKVSEMNVVTSKGLHIPVVPGPSTSTSRFSSSKGWALKTNKRGPRMGEKAKAFLLDKFNAGLTGHKADPLQVAKEMKLSKDKDGNPLFSPEEWRTAKQITSFFSRMSALYKQHGAQIDVEELDEEDLIALETEEGLKILNEAVLNDMEPSLHPVIVQELNLCEMTGSAKLQKLKVTQLSDICKELQLKTSGPQNRKKTFIGPIEDYIKNCTCRK